jgi:hypothetical protein
MKLYRYQRDGTFIDNNDIKNYCIELIEYEIEKETPKGYWVMHQYQKKFALKSSGRKRFAYDTKEKALNNFIIRTEKSVKICEEKLSTARGFLNACQKIKTENITQWNSKTLLK